MSTGKLIFRRRHLLLLASLLITLFIYLQGLPGGFVFDDLTNIKNNELLKIDQLDPNLLLEASFSSDSGIFKRPVSMLTFAINHAFTGMDPTAMKITNIAIHLINGLLLYIFTDLILKAINSSDTSWKDQPEKLQVWLPLIITSLWLVHPYNLSSVLYVVQRMTSLTAMFTLAAMICWIYGRLQIKSEKRSGLFYLLSSLFIFLPLAILSKENGFLIIPFIVLIELILFRSGTNIKWLNGSTLITCLIIITIISLYFLSQLEFFQKGYSVRSYTLTERVLTELRIIAIYLREIIQPDISRMSLFHDDMTVSKNLFNPVSTLWSLLLIMTSLLMAIFSFKKNPLITFGLLFFFAGHLMESSIIPLELVFEHRNYLSSFGILLLLTTSLISFSGKLRVFAPFMILLLMMYFSVSTLFRATQWSSLNSFYLSDLNHKPDSPRTNHNAAEMFTATMKQDPAKVSLMYPQARQLYLKSNQLDQNYTAGLVGLIMASYALKQPINPAWFDKFQQRLYNQAIDHHRMRELHYLSKCIISEVCKIDKDQFQDLLEKVLDDPRTKRQQKSKLAWISANYYFHHFQDKKAHDLLLLAHENNPENADYLVEAAKLAVDSKKIKTALAHLQKIESLKLSTKQQKLIKELKIKIKQNE